MSFTLDPATAISDPHGISWGMHPITWRNDDIPEVGAFNTLEDMLLDLADTGYAGTRGTRPHLPAVHEPGRAGPFHGLRAPGNAGQGQGVERC